MMVTEVTTAQGLLTALARGDAHISIQAHLDLTQAGGSAASTGISRYAQALPASVASIQGNCRGPIPAALLAAQAPPPQPLKQGQCLLLVSTQLLAAGSTQQLWVDNVYLRLQPRSPPTTVPPLIEVGALATSWLTNVTLQGTGQEDACDACGVLSMGDLHIEDGLFVGMHGNSTVRSVVGTQSTSATTILKRCKFLGTVMEHGYCSIVLTGERHADWFYARMRAEVLAADMSTNTARAFFAISGWIDGDEPVLFVDDSSLQARLTSTGDAPPPTVRNGPPPLGASISTQCNQNCRWRAPFGAWPTRPATGMLSRSLLSGTSQGRPAVAAVATAAELLQAVRRGVPHIEILQHLRLTGGATLHGSSKLGPLPPSIKSIRGRCKGVDRSLTARLGGFQERHLLPQQCIVTVDQRLLLTTLGSQLWLHNIYIRFQEQGNNTHPFFQSVMVVGQSSQVLLSQVAMHGSNRTRCNSCGVENRGGKLIAQDCVWSEFVGKRVLDTYGSGTTELVDCTFRGNVVTDAILDTSSGVDTVVWIERAAFVRNSSPFILRAYYWEEHEPTAYFSDDTSLSVLNIHTREVAGYDWAEEYKNSFASPLPPFRIEAVVKPMVAELQQVLPVTPSFPRAKHAQSYVREHSDLHFSPAPPHASQGLHLSSAAIVATTLGVLGYLLALLFGYMWTRERRLRRSNASNAQSSVARASSKPVRRRRHLRPTEREPNMVCSKALGLYACAGTSAEAELFVHAVTYDTFDYMTTSASIRLLPPGEDASMDERLEYLAQQIDSLAGAIICHGLMLREGASNRLQGGQAIVQFAGHKYNKHQYAAKFFVYADAFQQELQLYTDPLSPMRKLLPPVHAIIDNRNADFVDTHSYPMPCCIVMERGESLDMWLRRTPQELDMYTCMQVIQHVCDCLVDLHAAGFVHRDLKPANIMWLPSRNRWTVIDFGCVAKVGEKARIAFTMVYAAPEVICARYREHETFVKASTAADAWSLGLIAFELFSGKPALSLLSGGDKIISQLCGEEQLPWEGGGRLRAMLKKAGAHADAIFSLLNRCPDSRPSIKSFLDRCNGLYYSEGTGPSQDSGVSV